ncbi:Phospholipid phosphatase 3 [Larimichthys crocea]|uniref:Phospholipid phosphatase 3 n=1 Tax=Larimichthys crocea TaxID=215358 RepID=A0A6G0HVT5_LARCR|nr:Phospholipid phosphatase 3 [Larimichthys crocea]
MQKFNSTGTHSNTLPRDAELQLRLADSGGSGEGKENGAGKHFLAQPEEESSFCTKRKMLVGLDVICLCVASIPFFACELKAVTPYRRGFFCGDASITYPYVDREAIPDSLLIAGGIAITGIAIALGECYRVRFRGVHSRAFVRNCYVSCLYKELGSFLFGCCVGQSLTNMAKLSVGRLRPNFLSVCNITYASINCTTGSYISQVVCRQPNQKMVEEARKSFFSGHASFAMYTMLYLAVSPTNLKYIRTHLECDLHSDPSLCNYSILYRVYSVGKILQLSLSVHLLETDHQSLEVQEHSVQLLTR